MSFEAGHSPLLDVSIGDHVLMVSLFELLVFVRATDCEHALHVLHVALLVEYNVPFSSDKLFFLGYDGQLRVNITLFLVLRHNTLNER